MPQAEREVSSRSKSSTSCLHPRLTTICFAAAAGSRPSIEGRQEEVPRLPASLLQPLMRIQSSFVLSDPKLQGNPIVYASEKFLQLTGYPRRVLWHDYPQ